MIGIPTGYEGWLWDPVREAFLWTPVFDEHGVHITRPPGTVLYSERTDFGCVMAGAYVDPNDPLVLSWPNPVMMDLGPNSGYGPLLFDRTNPTETLQVTRVHHDDETCDYIDPPEEHTGLIQLVDAPLGDGWWTVPVQLEQITVSP